MRFELTIESESEAMTDDAVGEVVRLLVRTAGSVMDGTRATSLRDSNGNRVGAWSLDLQADAPQDEEEDPAHEAETGGDPDDGQSQPDRGPTKAARMLAAEEVPEPPLPADYPRQERFIIEHETRGVLTEQDYDDLATRNYLGWVTRWSPTKSRTEGEVYASWDRVRMAWSRIDPKVRRQASVRRYGTWTKITEEARS